jgi:hypothetical protein
VQLLVLCSLSVAAAGPYTTETGMASSNLVVVMDESASMQACLPKALELAQSHLDEFERISIVLASSTPQITLEGGSPAEARDALAGIAPKAVSADISSSMIQASNLLASDGGSILVVSDFISWIGDDPEATRKILQADGKVSIVFSDSYQGGDNVALVEAWDVSGTGYVNHTSQIHNYGPERSFSVTIRGPGGSSSRNADIEKDGDFYLSFTAYPGVNEISLDLQDAVSWDNKAYVSVPDLGKKNVLYLGESGPAVAALKSLPNVRIQTSGDYDDFDLVVVAKNASSDGKLNRYIDGGGNVIFIADDQQSPEYLPVRVSGIAEDATGLWVRNFGFAEGVHFDEIGLYSLLKATARRGSTTMVEANGIPALSYWRLGKGTVIYNGLEQNSDFYMRPEYPIFWSKMVNWITGVPDILDSNQKTGELIPLGEATEVALPSGSITTSALRLDEVGIYRFLGRALAANLYDPRESSLRRSSSVSPGEFQATSRQTMVEKDLSDWVMALAVLAILLELFIMRWRRET